MEFVVDKHACMNTGRAYLMIDSSQRSIMQEKTYPKFVMDCWGESSTRRGKWAPPDWNSTWNFFFHKNHKKCNELHRKKPMGTLALGDFFEVIHAPKRQFWFPPSKFRGEITRKRGRNKTPKKQNEKEKAKLWLIGTGYLLTPFWQDDPTAWGSGFFRYGPPEDPRPSSWRGLLPGSSNQLGSNASCFVFDSWLIS